MRRTPFSCSRWSRKSATSIAMPSRSPPPRTSNVTSPEREARCETAAAAAGAQGAAPGRLGGLERATSRSFGRRATLAWPGTPPQGRQFHIEPLEHLDLDERAPREPRVEVAAAEVLQDPCEHLAALR